MTTAGKIGTRSKFDCCTQCGAALAADDAARDFCQKTWGDPDGAIPTGRA
jgi:hypothetical protein